MGPGRCARSADNRSTAWTWTSRARARPATPRSPAGCAASWTAPPATGSFTAAPQCPYPDAFLGPAAGTAFGDAADAFDYVFVQFYNNFRSASSGAPFQEAFARWRTLSESGGPRVVVGLAATPEAAPAGGYVDPSALPALIDSVAGDPAFAGVMLWDVSFDRNSGDPTYSDVAEQALP